MHDLELSHALEGLADEADTRAVHGIRSMLRMRRHRMRRAAVAFAAGVATVGVVAGGAFELGWVGPIESGRVPSTAPTYSDFIPAHIDDGEPCPAAEAIDLATLSRKGAPTAWMPQDSQASRSSLAGTWMCSGTPSLTFANGVVIQFEPGWDLENPGERWAAMVDQWGAGSVETVLDRPAFVLPVSDTGPRGEVLVVVDNTLVRIYGNGRLPSEALTGIANSIDTARPLNAG